MDTFPHVLLTRYGVQTLENTVTRRITAPTTSHPVSLQKARLPTLYLFTETDHLMNFLLIYTSNIQELTTKNQAHYNVTAPLHPIR